MSGGWIGVETPVNRKEVSKMIQEIKDKYRTFSDAVIEKIEYQILSGSDTNKYLNAYITCFNWKTETWERVMFQFTDVKNIRLIETPRLSSSVIFEALLLQDDRNVIVDFFPIQVDGLGKLKEDPHSTFSIRCSKITYEVENK
ncbi:hypothetical protein GCM10027037_25430 [Mucilaginibacter koreensis]